MIVNTQPRMQVRRARSGAPATSLHTGGILASIIIVQRTHFMITEGPLVRINTLLIRRNGRPQDLIIYSHPHLRQCRLAHLLHLR